ncbi:hypothetical protein [Pseudohaliea sp.]|uniref:hypothetical protein n=1 Tax=Pseudohaliea sp. TaxID=2740289 RepID=UPI0032EF0E8C
MSPTLIERQSPVHSYHRESDTSTRNRRDEELNVITDFMENAQPGRDRTNVTRAAQDAGCLTKSLGPTIQ